MKKDKFKSYPQTFSFLYYLRISELLKNELISRIFSASGRNETKHGFITEAKGKVLQKHSIKTGPP